MNDLSVHAVLQEKMLCSFPFSAGSNTEPVCECSENAPLEEASLLILGASIEY